MIHAVALDDMSPFYHEHTLVCFHICTTLMAQKLTPHLFQPPDVD